MTLKFAVIGHPIGHTMSPFIHKKLFALKGINVEYSTLDIPPESLEKEMTETLSKLDGYNVTIPHKQLILPFLSHIDDTAKKYNAVNCVLKTNKETHGFSTDAFGFTQALKASGVALKGKVLVLGAGGAARTLAREAADMGCEVTFAVRSLDLFNAKELAGWLIENGGKATATTLDKITGEYDLLINATPVGMYPHCDAMPISKEQVSRCKAVFDAVYNPEKTMLLKTAEELNIKTVGGMAMLVWQAVKTHWYWYGGEFEVGEIEKIIQQANEEMKRIFYEK